MEYLHIYSLPIFLTKEVFVDFFLLRLDLQLRFNMNPRANFVSTVVWVTVTEEVAWSTMPLGWQKSWG